MQNILTHNDHDAISDLLVGRRVTKVEEEMLELDDGRRLKFVGNDGGCSCASGDYHLTNLNGVDNVITRVGFHDSPRGDVDEGDGVYEIFVFADNEMINLARFEGSDGNGYYGTGYQITVLMPGQQPGNEYE